MATPEAKLRAHAQANRDRLLEVARDALALDPAVPMNAIAKAARVGPGTLYRHFPTRQALVLGVYRREIEALAALSPQLLAKHPPLKAFHKWCEQLAEFARVKNGVADMLQFEHADGEIGKLYQPISCAVGQMIDACKTTGEMRPEIEAQDFLFLIGSMWRIPGTAMGQAQSRRLLRIIFRGMTAVDGAG